MESTLVFIPRRYIPSIDIKHPVKDERKILLPTGEAVIFDTTTKTITGGVLKENPIDMSLAPYTRNFARVSYTGQAIVIIVNRRAGIPEYTYSTVSNANEDPEYALIFYNNLSCTVHKSLIWFNTGERSKPAIFRYSTDQKFLDEVINPFCGWGLSLEDITPRSNQ